MGGGEFFGEPSLEFPRFSGSAKNGKKKTVLKKTQGPFSGATFFSADRGTSRARPYISVGVFLPGTGHAPQLRGRKNVSFLPIFFGPVGAIALQKNIGHWERGELKGSGK